MKIITTGIDFYWKVTERIIINSRTYGLCSKLDSRTIPMIMDLLTNDNEEIISHQEMILILRDRIENILKNYRPVMNGEIYLSGEDVCKLLHISKRTLQQYRDDNILPYIQIGGKIIYKETDLMTILEQNYINHKTNSD